MYVKAINSKDGHYEAFEEVIADSKARSGRKMRFFKTDGDGIFTGGTARDIYHTHSIRHIQSAPGDSASNDIAERTIRTFAELTTTNLLHANAPTSMWAEGMAMVEYVWNHIPVMKMKDGSMLSRTAILEGHKRLYKLDNLRAFGTKCHYMMTVQKKGGLKLALHEKARLGAIIGIEDNMPAYRVLDMDSKGIHRIPFAQLVSHEGHSIQELLEMDARREGDATIVHETQVSNADTTSASKKVPFNSATIVGQQN